LENITASAYGGVPHWGKKNWATGTQLQAAYGSEAWSAFEAQRVAVDPRGRFLNQYLRDRGIGLASEA
jgi:FAD/FMN-containing dehydrogenase